MADASRSRKLAAARKKLKQFQQKNTESPTSDKLTAVNNDSEVKEKSKEIIPSDRTSSENINDSNLTRVTSSSECIRQLNFQLNGLMTQTNDFLNGDSEDGAALNMDQSLEEFQKRNQELAALLVQEKQSTESSNQQLAQLKLRNAELQEQISKERDDFEKQQYKELAAVKEQLQVHIQTIGILVAEKTELQASLTQSQQTAKQKAGEADELQGRLKGSRQRVADLEREFGNASSTSQQFEKSSKEHSKDLDKIKIDLYKSNKSNEELKNQNSELTEKLNDRLTECQMLQEKIDDLEKKLTLSELHIKQLSNVNEGDSNQQLEQLVEEKLELEKNVTQFKDNLERLSQERDHLAENYQKLTLQLNQQIQNLNAQISDLALENEQVKSANHHLEQEIGNLQLELQNVPASEATDVSEILQLRNLCTQLESEKSQLEDQYRNLLSDSNQMSVLVEEKEQRLQELESTLLSASDQQQDNLKLLEALESDKVAASRALSQNKKLKDQLEELQNGFIRVNNDKLELTEKLQTEQYVTKELGDRLTHQEDELKELREQVSIKDEQLTLFQRSSSTELNKQIFQQNQLADRMRHFEAQGHLIEILQQELAQAQERVNSLTSQNSELRTMLANQAENLLKASSNDGGENRESSRKDDIVASLSTSVRQLELERDQLLRQLEEQRNQKETLKAHLQDMKDGNETETDSGEVISTEEFNKLKDAMKKLEARFTKTMEDIADLSDQKQQLEHLVLQLQGETETISEYVTLYQVQRGILKQRAAEKDEYIAHLARDREELKSKLTELQDLVYKLLYERQFYTNSELPIPGKVIPVKEKKENVHLSNGSNGISDDYSWPEDNFDDELNIIQEQVSSKKSKQPTLRLEQKIMDLISDIESTNLTEKLVPDNFHPCALCSGRLQTV